MSMKNTRFFHRALALVLTVALLAGIVLPQCGVVRAYSSSNGLKFTKIDGSDVDLQKLLSGADALKTEEKTYEPDDVVRVSIVLDRKSTIEAGFSTENIAQNRFAMAYRSILKNGQKDLTDTIEAEVLDGQNLDVVWNLTLVANIISANVKYSQISQIAALDGVKEVVIETQYEPAAVRKDTEAGPNMSTSTNMIGSTAAWAQGYTGAGGRIAIIDTGTDDDHQSFDAGAFLYSLGKNAEKAGVPVDDYLASLDLLDEAEIRGLHDQLNIKVDAADLYRNAKLPFAYNYVDEDLDTTHDNDQQTEHGSHVAGIAAANAYIPNGDGTYSSALDTVLVQGVAPDAQIITMKVFGKSSSGASDSDYMVAIEDAIVLGADSVNLSLGAPAPGFSRNEVYQSILDSLQNSDTVVVMSAGNSGYYAENSAMGQKYPYIEDVSMSMTGTPGTYVNSLSVASVDNDGATGEYIKVGDSLIFYTQTSYTNAPINTLAGEQPYILIDGYGSEEDFAAIQDVLAGKIAVCSRGGGISFVDKIMNAVKHGAIATIIYNNEAGSINMDLTDYTETAPAISVLKRDGEALRSAATPVTDADGKVLYYTGTVTVGNSIIAGSFNSDYYTMSDFSSWGVPGSLTMKPEITAPGGSIYSVNGQDPSGTAYETMSGTSMAAPQVAGMAALVAQYIKEHDLQTKTGMTVRALAQSLLMSTAKPLINENTGSYWSLLQQGSGLANVSNAINAQSYITMDPGATQSAADGKVKVELGDDPEKTGSYHYGFKINNLSDVAKTYTLTSDFFTQAVLASDTDLYMDTATTPLAVQVVYTVNGETFVPKFKVPADVDRDGDTDLDDAQAILDYVIGKNDGKALDLTAADLDGNGKVTTYDAHLLLANQETAYFTVQPGDSVSVAVDVALTEQEKEQLNRLYTAGTFIEGYTYVQPVSTEEGVFVDVEHSIPVLGYYGNWSDPSMFDRMGYVDLLYFQKLGKLPEKLPYSGGMWNVLGVMYPDMASPYPIIGNPYMVEEQFPADRLAINKDTTVYAYFTTLIRSAAAMTGFITDEAGNVLYGGRVEKQLFPAYYLPDSGTWWNTQDYFLMEQKPKRLDIQENEKFTVTLAAVSEYYEKYGELSFEQIKSLLDSGVLGEGTTLSTTLTLDNTTPEMLSVKKDLETGALTIEVQDNQYVAYVAVMNKSKTKIFKGDVPQQTEAGQKSSVTLDLTGEVIGKECVIAIGDYARNQTFYTVEYGGEPIDYSGRMFGFTQGSMLHGRENMWIEVSPDELYLYDDGSQQGYKGLSFFASAGMNVLAAEYVDGYVYMFADDGNIYVAEHESLNLPRKVGTYGNVNIVDVAMNYADGKLYALENGSYNKNIYTVDIQTGALTKAYSLTINNPGATGWWSSGDSLSGLAIDDAGNFYVVPEGGNDISYLFTWSAGDVTNGRVTPRAVGKTNLEYSSHPCLAWDHVDGVLYLSNNSYLLDGDRSNMLYTVDVETGAATLASDAWGTVAQEYCVSSCLYLSLRGMYIVPTQGTSHIRPSTTALSVELSKDAVTIMEGMSRTVTATVMPWTITDGSVTWTSSDESVATVKDGVIEAVSVGTATVTATANADGHPSATCEVTVKPLPSVKLSALLYHQNGNPVWADFQSTEPSNWNGVAAGDHEYAGGILVGDTILAHDGENVYALEADSSMLLENYGPVEVVDPGKEPWQWFDAAAWPVISDKAFGDFVTLTYAKGYSGYSSVLNFLTVDEENHKITQTRSISLPTWSEDDPLVAIAFAYSGTYNEWGVNYPANYFYGLTEGGTLYSLAVYYSWGYYAKCTELGKTDLALGPVHKNLEEGDNKVYASMIYDETSECLLVTSYAGAGELANLYALDVPSLSTVYLGNFGKNMYPAVSLYQYDRNLELRLEIDRDTLELYKGDTQTLTARVRPAIFTGGVVWTTSDASVATVDANGVVTAVGPGSAVITATTVDRNAAGEQLSVSATVQVQDVVSLDTTLHAQVQTPEGLKWVTIHTADMSMTVDGTVTVPAGDAAIETPVGGGAHDGKLYYTTLYDTYSARIYQADPANGYVATRLPAPSYFSQGYRIVDGTTAPAITVGDQTLFGFPLFLNYYGSLAWPSEDYQTMNEFTNSSYGGSLHGYDHLAAIAYAGQAEYDLGTGEMAPAQAYYVLNSEGTLHRFVLYWNGSSYSLAISTLGNIGKSFADEYALSMTMAGGCLVVADRSQGAADLYRIDGLDGELSCGKIGRVAGATGISTLYTDEDLNGTAPADSTAVTTGVQETAWVADAVPMSQNKQTVQNQATGSLHTIEIRDPKQTKDAVVVDDQTHTVTVRITADASTNGLLDVQYDADVLKLQTVQSAYLNSYVTENGLVHIAYADEAEINTTVATLTFSYEDAELERITDLVVLTKEDGKAQEERSQTTAVTLPAAVDKSALEKLHGDNIGKEEGKYTAESWKAFADAMAAAKAVLDDPEATQEQVDAAYAALQAAVEGLKEKPAQPVTPAPGPATGDHTPLMAMTAALLISGLAAGLLTAEMLRKRKHDR